MKTLGKSHMPKMTFSWHSGRDSDGVAPNMKLARTVGDFSKMRSQKMMIIAGAALIFSKQYTMLIIRNVDYD